MCNTTKLKYKKGFTLIELVLTVTIIGMLAASIIFAINLAISTRENSLAASHLRTAVTAFSMYCSENKYYPADQNPGVIPPEMTDYFSTLKINSWWSSPTELGGGWDWDNGYHFKYSVSISAPTRSVKQMTDFDKMIDDGNLSSGNFRQVGTQYHYIIEQ